MSQSCVGFLAVYYNLGCRTYVMAWFLIQALHKLKVNKLGI